MKPYRLGAPRPAPETPKPTIGVLRSQHAAPPPNRLLRVGGTMALVAIPITAAIATSKAGFSVAAGVMAAAGLAMAGSMAWALTPAKAYTIDLHEGGLALLTPVGRVELCFDDVDEVWFKVDVEEQNLVRIATLTAVRLVANDKRSMTVAATVDRFDVVLERLERACSYPLIAQAEEALAAGEVLTFGKVLIDREGIMVGDAKHAWSAIKLSRFQVDRVCLFVSQTVIPWRAISWNDVPHPRLFFRLLRSLAPDQENDVGLARGFLP